jgi:hypothetical protein
MTYRLINGLIISFFLLYAISPLSYKYAGDKPDATYPAAGTQLRNFSILFLELFYSAFVEQPVAEDGPAADRLVIRKSNIFLRSPDKGVSHPFDSAVLTVTFSAFSVRSPIVGYSKIRRLYNSTSLCSGLSPPFLLSA